MNPVRLDVQDGVLVITLDRPKANAIDAATSQALYEGFDRLREDGTLRAAVVTGAGERFFSAGWDLKAAAGGEAIDADHGPGGFAGLTELFDLDKPVIAAVNGLALGGGFELALAADLIVAEAHAEFALPEVKVGMIADSGGVLRLPRRLPRAVATELLLTGRRLDAVEAARWGLVNQVVDGPDTALERALTLAHTIREGAPLAVAAVKEVLRATEQLGVEDAYATMRNTNLPRYRAMLTSTDAQEGPRAFAEKRAPRWTGT
ncbi:MULTISPECIES: enoyl-CoA hydratase-related protein [unclassified Streptomyces]|uniref:enoyl-CoA hydratase-related protein n=1 Tax=unclassified Streptomyces TaxID=2593676 RepID=UPI002DD8CE24|nr:MULTISPECIES: enoyl-CoA hydratase-related protein [unclassified Streptomyces]WSA91430.1 enoyl-CoA hydratase-related protein [Streptomyces sp. NBC_01795]WSB75754.1 enoyl-CoA hydratase-related protein [Streptomyces sp. NBC_01775]WSS15961.1 enoyl-CoA hydratase-related protein [Streptomyces sp. NBC_01186]WSS44779.1 enoyl-CoA hydratase-related protein [Streptomyces sp. NBC_01187]